MGMRKYIALAVLGFFLSACAGMSKNQAAIVGATTCGLMGAGLGGVIGNNSRDISLGAAIPVGAAVGALLCGGLAYLIAQEPPPPPPPKPAPPPPPPPPPPHVLAHQPAP